MSQLMALAIRFDQLVRDGVVADYIALALLGHVSRAQAKQITLALSPLRSTRPWNAKCKTRHQFAKRVVCFAFLYSTSFADRIGVEWHQTVHG